MGIETGVQSYENSRSVRLAPTVDSGHNLVTFGTATGDDYAIFALDPQGHVTSWNANAERIKGYTAADIIGCHFSSFYPAKEVSQGIPQHALQQAATVGSVVTEGWRVRKDGSKYWSTNMIIALFDHRGYLNGFSKITRDVATPQPSESSVHSNNQQPPKLPNFMDSAIDAIIAVNAQRQITLFNPAAEVMFRCQATAAIGQSLALFIPQYLLDTQAAPIDMLCSPVGKLTITQGQRADGASFPLEASVSPVVVAGEQWYTVIVRDITQRKQIELAQQARLDLQQHLIKLADALSGALYTLYQQADGSLTVLYASPAIESLLGLRLEELLNNGADFFQQVHPADLPHVQATLRAAMHTMSLWRHEYRIQHPQKGECWVESSSVPQREHNGRIVWHGFIHDITARKHGEEARRQGEERLKLALTATQTGVWEWDMQSDKIFWSPECDAIFGTQPTQVTRTILLQQFIHPQDVAHTLAKFEQSLATRTVCANEFRIIRPDGSICWVSQFGQGIYSESGRLLRVIGTMQDITKRVQVEEQLRQSQKMEAIGQLASGIAHDFNNLLTVITGYSDLLLSRLKPDERNRTFAANIRQASDRAATLTRQLLTFSRKQLLEPQLVNLNDIVANIQDLLMRLLNENIILTTFPDPALSHVNIDPNQIEQVLINLAVNARDAMPQGGLLTITLQEVELDAGYSFTEESRPGRYVELAVADTGCGMTPEVQARIFEPFFTTKEVGKGTGLGLSTVFGIVRQSEGHIHVWSEFGIGTCFKIYLPIVASHRQAFLPDNSMDIVQQGNETILLVEDDDDVRSIATFSLEAHGYTVLVAPNGRKALALAEQHDGTIHLLVTDIVMPELDGWRLAALLQARNADLKVLFMSGYTDDTIIRADVIDDPVAFLYKPFTSTGLANKVRTILDQPG